MTQVGNTAGVTIKQFQGLFVDSAYEELKFNNASLQKIQTRVCDQHLEHPFCDQATYSARMQHLIQPLVEILKLNIRSAFRTAIL